MAELNSKIEISIKDLEIVTGWAEFIKEVADWKEDYSSTYLKLKAKKLLNGIDSEDKKEPLVRPEFPKDRPNTTSTYKI